MKFKIERFSGSKKIKKYDEQKENFQLPESVWLVKQ